jgi:chemotaxis protein MotB
MVRQALIFASILSALIVAGIFGYSVYQQKKEFNQTKDELVRLKENAGSESAETAALRQELTNRQARIDELIKEKEEVTHNQQQVEQQMRSSLESKDVTISELEGRLTVNILDRVLFASGEAELKPEGEKVLSQVANVLTQLTNRQVYVIGHTDNVPIKASAFSRYSSNWELSTARATSAVRYLTEKAGVDPFRLAAVGYGEYHPVAENFTPEGRAKNRRIAIVIMPEQFNPLEQSSVSNSPAIPPPSEPSLSSSSTNSISTNALPPSTNSTAPPESL